MTSTEVAGRTDVTARALERTVTAIAAERLGVTISDVRVVLSDEAGSLGIAIAAPVRLPALVDAGDVRLIDRTRAARDGIRELAAHVVGRQIGTITVRLTHAVIRKESRVR